MPVYALTSARGEHTRTTVITHVHSAKVCSRFSFTPSHGSQPHRDCEPLSRQVVHGVQRCHIGRQFKAQRCQSAAAAEPIAFGRTDNTEPEEEDFYSILGVVRSLWICCKPVFVGGVVAVKLVLCTCSLTTLTKVN